MTTRHSHGRRRRGSFVLAFLLGAITLAVAAWSIPESRSAIRAGLHGGISRAESVQDVREHLQRGAERAFEEIHATPEQELKVLALLDEIAPELFELHQQRAATRQAVVELLAAEDPTAVDRTALRARAADLAGQAADTLGDAAERLALILRPEQRSLLMSTWNEHR